MDNRLPKGLEKLISWITESNAVQSWRYTIEQNQILSIKFKSRQDITSNQYENTTAAAAAADMPRCFRAKPPSTVIRDFNRQQKWIDDQGYSGDFCSANSFNYETCSNNIMQDHKSHITDDSGVIMSDMHKSQTSTPLNQNAPQKHKASQQQHGPVVNHDSSMHISTTKEDCSIQTDEHSPNSIAIQTNNIINTRDASFQIPPLKKRSSQTNKIAYTSTVMQTNGLLCKDVGSQCQNDMIQSSSKFTSTSDIFYMSHVSTITDPGSNRHSQTLTIETKDKKTGPKSNDCDMQTEDEQDSLEQDYYYDSDINEEYYEDEESYDQSEIKKRQDEINLSIFEIREQLRVILQYHNHVIEATENGTMNMDEMQMNITNMKEELAKLGVT